MTEPNNIENNRTDIAFVTDQNNQLQALTPKQYMETRVDEQIDWLNNKSIDYQRNFKRLRKAELIAAALIPFLTALTVASINWGPLASLVDVKNFGTILVGLLGITVTVISGVIGLEQYQKNWIEYRVLCESLKREKNLYLANTELYKNSPEAFQTFVSRTEALLAKENTVWSENNKTPPTQQQSQGQK